MEVSSEAASHSEVTVDQAVLEKNLANQAFFEIRSMSNLHIHTESEHTPQHISGKNKRTASKHCWEHLFLLKC